MNEVFLRPFNGNHSIREAVISVFLAAPIIKPERFQKLIEGGFAGDFHLFETTNALSFQFKAMPNATIQPQAQPNVGFRFLGFGHGRVAKVLQASNESNGTFISYHSLAYTRWQNFLDDYFRYLKVLSDFQPDIFIRTISVHYIDEFTWTSKDDMDLSFVFNKTAKYMSEAFLESSKTSNFIYTTEKKDGEGQLQDRLEIKVVNQEQKNITISHNATKVFNEVQSVSALVADGSELTGVLQRLHDYNKSILTDILTDSVKELIHLQK